MALPVLLSSRESRNRDRQKRLEYAGYSFEDDGAFVALRRPNGQTIDHYRHLGWALNRAEKDIRLARVSVQNSKTLESDRRYWSRILAKYDQYGTFESWADRQMEAEEIE